MPSARLDQGSGLAYCGVTVVLVIVLRQSPPLVYISMMVTLVSTNVASTVTILITIMVGAGIVV